MIINLWRLLLNDLLKKNNQVLDKQQHIDSAINWLKRAQDIGEDHGISEGYHIFKGWLPSYPETTGYIAKTFWQLYKKREDKDLADRAKKMIEWECDLIDQFGATPDANNDKIMVFDSGQVLLGLIETFKQTKDTLYEKYIIKLSDWLLNVQDEDGSWQKFSVRNIPHTYYSRVGWALADAGKILEKAEYKVAADKNAKWVISNQKENGWFEQSSFRSGSHRTPFTHTLAYTIRGLFEIGCILESNRYIEHAKKSIDFLINATQNLEMIPITLNEHWRGPLKRTCLTGDAQFSIICSKMYMTYQERKYLNFSEKINLFLCQKQVVSSDQNINGALAGSFPLWGDYIHFCYPNWAVKFFIDALMWHEILKAGSTEE